MKGGSERARGKQSQAGMNNPLVGTVEAYMKKLRREQMDHRLSRKPNAGTPAPPSGGRPKRDKRAKTKAQKQARKKNRRKR